MHSQGASREPITFIYENTWADASRQAFAGTQSRLYILNEATGYWNTLLSNKGAFGSVWRGATLNDTALFANGVDDVYAMAHNAGISTITQLVAHGITAPRVIIEFSGFVFIMNDIEVVGGVPKRCLTRVRWCDLNQPLSWELSADPNNPDTYAGYQDLPYGDEIIAAGVMLGSLYIFTRRSIWRVYVANAVDQTFSFQRVYNEPKNQTGCLVYPYTLTTDGENFWYMSRDAIYKWNPYLVAPERKDSDGNDWLYRASGVIYTKIDTAMSGVLCNLPVAEFIPTSRELWFSWPSGNNTVNNWTLVAQIDQKTADVVDHGFSAFANYRRVPTAVGLCNESQDFLAASGSDWAIKSIGGVFYREMAAYDPVSPTTDLDLETSYTTVGYYSELRGMIPLGFTDRDKLIRRALLDNDVTEENVPCAVRMQIGNSHNLSDPNDLDDICAVMWRDLGTRELACLDGKKISQMKALNQRTGNSMEWPCYYAGRFLYFWLRVESADGSAAIGGDVCFQRIDFDCLAREKP